MAKLSPVFNDTQFDDDGNLLVGGLIYTYAANSSTPLATYTDDSGTTPHSNPIVLDARGEAESPIWLAEGNFYKLRLFDALGNFIREFDNVAGVGDNSITLDQWVASGVTPTYVSANQFTLPGDQTSAFQVNRRIKATVTAGTVYGYIAEADYDSLTIMTVVLDSGSLDAGLSAVQFGLITPDNTSLRVTSAMQADGSITTAKIATGAVTADKLAASAIPKGHISGLTLSTAGSSATMSISAGQAVDSTNSTFLSLASAISKTTSAWAVGTGNGGLDTGTIANSTWYHFYLICRPDTGVVDAILSTSASAPTLPENYTQYRRTGAGRTDASGKWTAFFQEGDTFTWATPANSANVSNPGTSAVLRTVLTPLGIKTLSNLIVSNSGSTVSYHYYSDPAATDVTPTQQISQTALPSSSTAAQSAISIRTNTSSQIRSRASFSDSNTAMIVTTVGWVDSRGKND